MKNISVKLFSFLFVIASIFQSCDSDDEVVEIIDDNSDVANELEVAALDSELVIEWTDLLLELERYASGRPNGSARALAYIYLAAYETAVPGMTDRISNSERLDGLTINNEEQPTNINWEIALNSCLSKVLDHFLLNLTSDLNASISAFEASTEGALSIDLSETLVDDSKAWGEYVANQVIAYSQTDVEAETQVLDPQPLSYEPPVGEGFWTYSADPERALFPYWESARTFVISPEETTSKEPIDYSEQEGSKYYDQMMEVYEVNNSAREEDGEQLWIAEFWSDDVEGLMFSPPARQFSIANQLVTQHSLNLEETLELYLKLGFSLNDAAVSTWKYKYQYMVMRPNVYIHEFIDPDFQTNLFRLVFWPNPSFPGYPSGHSCFASAAAGIFIDFFGNETEFTDRSHEGREEFRGTPRSYTSFEQLAEENAFSRIPLGVHIRMDCEEGLRLGYEISDAINRLDMTSP